MRKPAASAAASELRQKLLLASAALRIAARAAVIPPPDRDDSSSITKASRLEGDDGYFAASGSVRKPLTLIFGFASVPEPATAGLVIVGFALFARANLAGR